MILGQYKGTLTKKGELVLPDPVLSTLGTDLVISRGFERNLLLFPRSEWQSLSDRLLAKPISHPDVRSLRRRLFSAATELSPDANGRIHLPPTLRDFAGITDEAILAGMYNYLELWSADRWLPTLTIAEEGSEAGVWDDIGI